MSTASFLSPSWHRVAALRPRFKSQTPVRRHRYRGAVWYVVQDPASGRLSRFTPAVYQLMGLMDGERMMDEVWNAALDALGDAAPGQEEVIRVLSQLHAADLLQAEVTPDTAELFERQARQRRARRGINWRNPFSIRIPLWNPDRFLTATLPLVRPFLGWPGAVLYLLFVGLAVLLTAIHWPELTENISDRVLSAQNLLILAFSFPVLKLLHELGHGYAVKLGGGEVHEMGVLLLVFMPVAYVDASAAAGFRRKGPRVLVGAAGMLVETMVASLAMLVWATLEPGLVRAILFNVMIVAGVSTVIFNGNPLLRYDGYFILSDLVEIPNLAARGAQWWRYIAERWLFRLRHVEPPPLARGEKRWFLFYTPIAFVYRVMVMAAIVLFVAGEWLFVGVALAIWGVITMVGWPLGKFIGYLWLSPRLGRSRRRAVVVSAIGAGVCAALLAFVPMPHRIQAEGVVWMPEEALVRAGEDGFVRALLARPGAEVASGVPLLETVDPTIGAELQISESRITEINARLDMQTVRDRVQANVVRQDLQREQAQLDRLRERESKLVIRSASSGQFVLDQPDDLPDRFLRKGQLIGYLSRPQRATVRVIVPQDDIDLVRSRLVRAEVRLAERLADVHPATIAREVPMAKHQLPSPTLSSEGGGKVAIDPRDPKGQKTLTSSFQFDLELPESAPQAIFGGRAHVRFVLAPEPLWDQWHRRLRQAFLARFNA